MSPYFTTSRAAELIFIALYTVWYGTELAWSRLRRPTAEAEVQDRWSGRAVLAGIWLGESVAWVAGFAAPALAMHSGRPLIFAVGMLLVVAGLILRWYSIRLLGKYFTVVVATRPDQKTIEAGPYRFIRHPSYAGGLLTILGFGLAFTNYLSLLGSLIFPILGYSYRIIVEERVLANRLGAEYREYMKRTKRIIPFVL